MNVKALGIYFRTKLWPGVLLQYVIPATDVISRFVAGETFIN